MRLLFLGDLVGRAGRDIVTRQVPQLRSEYRLDVVIANVDNAAGGFGITREVCRQLLSCGIDFLTTGDHLWDQKGIEALLEEEPRLLRPHNFPSDTPGSGCREATLKDGRKLVLLHLLGQVFHKEYLDSPFRCAEKALQGITLGQQAQAVFVDFHAEATSEKNAMGVFLDGKVSAVVGSHTHVPTNDARILAGGSAYITDAGMCGDYYNTIIGFAPEGPMANFLAKRRKFRMQPGSGPGELRGVFIETDDRTGHALTIEPIHRK